MGDSNTQESVGEDSIEWHYSKIKTYFDSCFDTVYNPFLDMSDDLVNALLDYVNDDQHTGPKAEETKKVCKRDADTSRRGHYLLHTAAAGNDAGRWL
ncbi:MAG: hypothetical protein IJV29_02430 [Butyrivibrio sp.]|nr:hypothetical protein [Butyrivibrio sp.]